MGAQLSRQFSHQSACTSRPATTVDTQSSSIELIAWQVQTHASGDTSQSDEIFRPVSVVRSVRSSYTRDSPLSGTFARTMVTDSLFQVPTTPLRSGIDYVGDKPRPASMGQVARARQSLVEYFMFPMPPSVHPMASDSRRVQSAHGRPAPKTNSRDQSAVCPWQHLDSAANDPRRSWLELDQLRNDGGCEALQHRRRSTVDSVSLHPRSTSIRHRPRSSDPQYRPSPRSNTTSVGLGPVSEYLMRASSLPRESVSPMEARIAFASLVRPSVPKHHFSRSARRLALIVLTVILVVHQLLFLVFEAPYLWSALSPAPPLAAGSLFLMLDALLLRLHRSEASQTTWLYFSILLVCSMAYDVALTSAKLALLTQQAGMGADAPGIHFSQERRKGESALEQVVEDMPMSVVEAVLALGLMVVGVGMVVVSAVRLGRRRRRRR